MLGEYGEGLQACFSARVDTVFNTKEDETLPAYPWVQRRKRSLPEVSDTTTTHRDQGGTDI